jgi:small subunit ribosomal protein S16
MATTIRLTRMGRKQRPFYRVVVVDSRGRRDGNYIESLGYYNPIPDAYELDIDVDRAMQWLEKGVTLSPTAKSLLRNQGVLYRWHLQKQGTDAAEIETKVTEFLSRRGAASDAIKAESTAKLEAWRASKEEAAKAKAKEAEAAAAATEAKAEKSEAESAEEAPAEEASAEAAPAEAAAEAKADEDSSTEEKA